MKTDGVSKIDDLTHEPPSNSSRSAGMEFSTWDLWIEDNSSSSLLHKTSTKPLFVKSSSFLSLFLIDGSGFIRCGIWLIYFSSPTEPQPNRCFGQSIPSSTSLPSRADRPKAPNNATVSDTCASQRWIDETIGEMVNRGEEKAAEVNNE